MSTKRLGFTVVAVAMLVGVLFAGTALAGGVGGYNPGDEVYPPGTTPVVKKVVVQPSGSVSPVASGSVLTATSSLDEKGFLAPGGAFAGAVCSQTASALWWISLVVLAAVLLWYGRRKGTYLWYIVIYGVVWFLWAWKFCEFGFWWLPLLLAVIIWLLSVPKPDDSVEAK